MTVKTHRETDTEQCRFCPRPATFYSQNEGKGLDAPPLGGVVSHCQLCREAGRRAALTEPTLWEKLGLDRDNLPDRVPTDAEWKIIDKELGLRPIVRIP